MAKEKLNKNYEHAEKYVKALNAANLGASVPKLAYVETIGKYIGKRGKVRVSALKSQKAVKEFNAALKQFNKSRPKISDIGKIQKTASKSGGKIPFKDIAKQAAENNVKLARQIRDETIDTLRNAVDVGSDFVNLLASDSNISTDDFYTIINSIKEKIESATDAERESMSADELYSKIANLEKYGDVEYIASIFEQMINSDKNSYEIADAAHALIDNGYDPTDYDLDKLAADIKDGKLPDNFKSDNYVKSEG